MSAQAKPSTAFDGAQVDMGHLRDRSIGSLIAEARQLDADQVATILAHQRLHGLRFGEAAIALGFASPEQVMQALALQFHYPLAAPAQRERSPHLVALNQPFSARAEMFRAIRSQVLMRLNREGMPRCAGAAKG
jgi:protein-tyrosine kinase